jgi:hypothetical protein
MGGGAWPFLVGGAICLVNSVNERDLGLLNSYMNPSIQNLVVESSVLLVLRGGNPSGYRWGPSLSGGRVDGHAS